MVRLERTLCRAMRVNSSEFERKIVFPTKKINAITDQLQAIDNAIMNIRVDNRRAAMPCAASH